MDGGFCLQRVSFGGIVVPKSKIKKLFTEAVNYQPDAKACFKRHPFPKHAVDMLLKTHIF